MCKVRGFTLVEILIVVIILGILAAIVIPQFTSASTEARHNSVAATLKTLRGQLALFKIQHHDRWPNLGNGPTNYWAIMLGKSNASDIGPEAGAADGKLGPYLRSAPVNPVNGKSAVGNIRNANFGWMYNPDNGNIQALDATGNNVLPY